jgi:hypothetical protein
VNQRSLARKVLTLIAVFAFAGVTFWLVARPRVMSGTKTFFYTAPAPTKASPGGSAPETTTATTNTTTSAASTTAQP